MRFKPLYMIYLIVALMAVIFFSQKLMQTPRMKQMKHFDQETSQSENH